MSAPRTPPQNGIVERRNIYILDCARTLLIEKNVAQKYQKEAISTAVYTLNWVQIKKGTNLTPYELWHGHASSVKYFGIFGSKCYILKDTRNGKFDAKSDEGIFVGYSTKSKAYKCLNSNTNKIVESVNVKIDEYAERNEADSKREPEGYRSFVYIEEEEEASNRLAPDAESWVSNAKQQKNATKHQENSAKREQEHAKLQENAAEYQ